MTLLLPLLPTLLLPLLLPLLLTLRLTLRLTLLLTLLLTPGPCWPLNPPTLSAFPHPPTCSPPSSILGVVPCPPVRAALPPLTHHLGQWSGRGDNLPVL